MLISGTVRNGSFAFNLHALYGDNIKPFGPVEEGASAD
jgi:hypothetical protein